jgi:hypothetical protein
MLELRPSCEHCNKSLPPDSLEARICSYECTFCATCVDTILGNVCPNCGGGFVARPIRPSKNWKGESSCTIRIRAKVNPAGETVNTRQTGRVLLAVSGRCSGHVDYDLTALSHRG